MCSPGPFLVEFIAVFCLSHPKQVEYHHTVMTDAPSQHKNMKNLMKSQVPDMKREPFGPVNDSSYRVENTAAQQKTQSSHGELLN